MLHILFYYVIKHFFGIIWLPITFPLQIIQSFFPIFWTTRMLVEFGRQFGVGFGVTWNQKLILIYICLQNSWFHQVGHRSNRHFQNQQSFRLVEFVQPPWNSMFRRLDFPDRHKYNVPTLYFYPVHRISRDQPMCLRFDKESLAPSFPQLGSR